MSNSKSLRALFLAALAACGLLGVNAFAAEVAKSSDTAWIAQSVPAETVYGSREALDPQQVWVSMIDSAKKTLELGEFYFTGQKGEALEPVIAAIKRAAGRGVEVRVIADGVFYKKEPAVVDSLRKVENVRVRIINFDRIAGGVMHAKYFIVDGTEFYVGSQNMDWRSLTQIHEIGIRVKNGRMARAFRRVFFSDWAAAVSAPGKPEVEFPDEKPLSPSEPETLVLAGSTVAAYALFSPKDVMPRGDLNEIDEYVRLMDAAKSEIKVQVMNYSLARHRGGGKGAKWTELDDALRRAAGRGVAVKLIFADWTMKAQNIADIKALARVPNITVKISSIPQAKRGPIPYARVEHCKYMLIDGKTSVISTSNWEYSYFYTSRDASVVLEGAKAASILGGIFDTAWNGPYVKYVDQTGGEKKTINE